MDEEMRFIEAEVKYEGYLRRQEKEIAEIGRIDRIKIPEAFDFSKVHGLTREAVEKLEKSNPKTLGEAKRIPGLTPVALINIYLYLKAQNRRPEGKRMFHVKH